MFSIIIPLYNKEGLIRKTLETVFGQTYPDFEVIVVNDGSTDGSIKEIEENYNDPRLRIINQKNSGVSAARNRGIDEAKGEYIAFLDADDEWLPCYLENKKKLIERYPHAIVYASNYEFRKTDGSKRMPLLRGLPFSGDTGIMDNYFEVASHSDPPLWTSAVVVRKEAFKDIRFPLGIKSGEDLLTWARLATIGKIAWSAEVAAIYNQGFSNPRPPETVDRIGECLEALYARHRENIHLRGYVAFWYKMRMCRCLAHKMWGQGSRAFGRSMRLNPFQTKIFLSIPKYIIKGK